MLATLLAHMIVPCRHLRLIVVSITTLLMVCWVYVSGVVTLTTVIVVVGSTFVLVLVVRICISLLMMTVAIIVVTSLRMSRHDYDSIR